MPCAESPAFFMIWVVFPQHVRVSNPDHENGVCRVGGPGGAGAVAALVVAE
jgi:hypothetical protein